MQTLTSYGARGPFMEGLRSLTASCCAGRTPEAPNPDKLACMQQHISSRHVLSGYGRMPAVRITSAARTSTSCRSRKSNLGALSAAPIHGSLQRNSFVRPRINHKNGLWSIEQTCDNLSLNPPMQEFISGVRQELRALGRILPSVLYRTKSERRGG